MGDSVGGLFYYSNMLSNTVSGVVARVDAALDELGAVELGALSAMELVGLA